MVKSIDHPPSLSCPQDRRRRRKACEGAAAEPHATGRDVSGHGPGLPEGEKPGAAMENAGIIWFKHKTWGVNRQQL